MERVSLTQGNTQNRGTVMTPQALQALFPVATIESGYAGEQNGAVTIGQSIELEVKNIWASGLINKKVTKKWTNASGMEESYETSSRKDSDNILKIRLQTKDFGTAVSKNKAYTGKDSTGKAALADWIFGVRQYLTEFYANFLSEARAMKELVNAKAKELGLLVNAWDAIDFSNQAMQDYWKSEIEPKYTKLRNEYSLQALITKEGSPFKNATVYRKDGQFTNYALYLA